MRPAISSFSCVTRSRNWAFCPARPLTRTSNNLLSLAMTSRTSGSSARSSSIGGNLILSRPRCSASSRAARAHNPFSVLTTIARLALTTVSSSRTTISPALTTIAVAHPHLADHAAGRMLHLLDVGIRPPPIPARSARPRSAPSRPSRRTRRPARAPAPGRRSDASVSSGGRRAIALGHDLATPASETILIGAGGATRCSTCPRTVSFGPNACMRPSFSTSS